MVDYMIGEMRNIKTDGRRVVDGTYNRKSWGWAYWWERVVDLYVIGDVRSRRTSTE